MDRRCVILVAGIPAAGKTRFARHLSRELGLVLLCKDDIKEKLWDRFRYDTAVRENSRLYGAAAYDLLFFFAQELMRAGTSFILESNFAAAAQDVLLPFIQTYAYDALTVLFDADMKVLHRRFIERDELPQRHPGLVSQGFFADYERFASATEPLRHFCIGKRIVVDTTDFSKVDYEPLVREIKKFHCR